MFQRIVITALLLLGQLLGPFVQLRGHLEGFVFRTAERHQDFCELNVVHEKGRAALLRRPRLLAAQQRGLYQITSPIPWERP